MSLDEAEWPRRSLFRQAFAAGLVASSINPRSPRIATTAIPVSDQGRLVWVLLSVRNFVPVSANRRREATSLDC